VEHDLWDGIAIGYSEEVCHAIAAEGGVQCDCALKEFRHLLHPGFRPNPRVYRETIRDLIDLRVSEDVASDN
jgi:hypothetical protein